MANNILIAYGVADFLFIVTGCIMLGFSVIVQSNLGEDPEDGRHAARNLIYEKFPFEAGIANSVFVLVTFALTIPAMITPTRGWLKISGWLTAFCALFTMCLGVFLWVLTLTTQEDFHQIWTSESPEVQSLMQTEFECCGYFNSTSPAFVTDDVCSSRSSAALQPGCVGPVSAFANNFLDNIFTGVFGMVGIDAIFIICTTMLLKDRKERERFRHIDEKTGARSL